ncbi:hypothetical protein OG921_24390 [Aldersonia sp. NBC_00410]|nr:hypothetical protein [Aldersonia sp. NBC_00410]MCX5044829.1 hypothetical protein [Aldersonia sp. NBC_00410]MCX5046316.1 hypothetical protein [Aldersonia sp. NBC_00410]
MDLDIPTFDSDGNDMSEPAAPWNNPFDPDGLLEVEELDIPTYLD